MLLHICLLSINRFFYITAGVQCANREKQDDYVDEYVNSEKLNHLIISM